MPLNHEQVVDSTLATLSLLPAIKLARIRACTSHPSHTTHMHVATNRPYRTHPATPNESRKDASLLFGVTCLEGLDSCVLIEVRYTEQVDKGARYSHLIFVFDSHVRI